MDDLIFVWFYLDSIYIFRKYCIFEILIYHIISCLYKFKIKNIRMIYSYMFTRKYMYIKQIRYIKMKYGRPIWIYKFVILRSWNVLCYRNILSSDICLCVSNRKLFVTGKLLETFAYSTKCTLNHQIEFNYDSKTTV